MKESTDVAEPNILTPEPQGPSRVAGWAAAITLIPVYFGIMTILTGSWEGGLMLTAIFVIPILLPKLPGADRPNPKAKVDGKLAGRILAEGGISLERDGAPMGPTEARLAIEEAKEVLERSGARDGRRLFLGTMGFLVTLVALVALEQWSFEALIGFLPITVGMAPLGAWVWWGVRKTRRAEELLDRQIEQALLKSREE